METILKVENICYSAEQKSFIGFTGEKKEILKNISFDLEKGKILGIAGESGSGKTTLAKLIAGIIKPSSGKIIINDQNRKTRINPVQILFQNNGEVLNPFREIEEVVEEAIRLRSRIKLKEEKEKIFNSVNFPGHLWKRKGFELSGGEQQRAALARLLAVEPELLILDEPFSAQDPDSQINFLNLFKKINEEFGITLICISHNLKLLRLLANNIIIMYKGEIVETGSSDEIFSSPKHPYTKFLLRAENYDLKYEELKFEQ